MRSGVRWVGFGVTNFSDEPPTEETDLFGISPEAEKMKKRERLAAALDAIHRRQDHA